MQSSIGLMQLVKRLKGKPTGDYTHDIEYCKRKMPPNFKFMRVVGQLILKGSHYLSDKLTQDYIDCLSVLEYNGVIKKTATYVEIIDMEKLYAIANS